MKRKYCELNVVESTSTATNIQNIKQLIKLGYNVVAINRKMDPPAKVNKNTPKLSKTEIHSFARSMEKLKKIVEELKKGKTTLSSTATTSATPTTPTATTTTATTPTATTPSTADITDVDFAIPDDFELLSRLTFELDTPDQGRLLKISPYKDMLNDVDIIAVAPNSEGVFKGISERKIECDIIALHLENDLPFQLTRQMIQVATELNLSFEISYGHAIKSLSVRKSVFQNGSLIGRRCKRAKGLIISCHGESCLDFRSPHDVINMAHLFSVGDNVSHDVVSKNCWDVIAHARLRKHTFMGAVAVEEISLPVEIHEDEIPAKKRKIVAAD